MNINTTSVCDINRLPSLWNNNNTQEQTYSFTNACRSSDLYAVHASHDGGVLTRNNSKDSHSHRYTIIL